MNRLKNKIVLSIVSVVSIALSQVETDDYRYAITLDQASYQSGDTILIHCNMTNISSDTIVIISPWWYDLQLIDSSGYMIDGLAFLPIDSTFIIPPADSLTDLMAYRLDNIVVNTMSSGVYRWLMKPFYDYESNVWDTASFYYQSTLSTDADHHLINDYKIGQLYPNPANPAVNVSFEIYQDSNVDISVFDLLGAEVAKVLSGKLKSGSYTINFDMTNHASGVYLVKYDIDGRLEQRKFSFIK